MKTMQLFYYYGIYYQEQLNKEYDVEEDMVYEKPFRGLVQMLLAV